MRKVFLIIMIQDRKCMRPEGTKNYPFFPPTILFYAHLSTIHISLYLPFMYPRSLIQTLMQTENIFHAMPQALVYLGGDFRRSNIVVAGPPTLSRGTRPHVLHLGTTTYYRAPPGVPYCLAEPCFPINLMYSHYQCKKFLTHKRCTYVVVSYK